MSLTARHHQSLHKHLSTSGHRQAERLGPSAGSQGDIDPITEKVVLSLSLEDGTGTEVRHLPEQLLLASPEIADEREPFHP